MAGETNTYTSNASTNIREDLANLIYKISPHERPFMNAIGKGKADSTKVEWLEDSDAAPAANAVLEVADATFSEATQPSRLNNYTQIMRKTYSVSDTMDAVNLAGRQSESARLMAKKFEELADDVEYALINNTTAAAGNSSTARTLRGAMGWVTTNKYAPGSYSASNVFTEAVLLDQMQAAWTAGGKPSMLILPPQQVRKVITWNQANRQTINQDASDRKLVMNVLVVETPFGIVKVMPSRYFAEDDQSGTKYDSALCVDPSRFELCTLRPIATKKLAETGNYSKVMIEGEMTLKCYNEKANAAFSKMTRV